jgi:hypothetical protein
MHVYAPPYTSCKVWAGPESALNEYEIGTIGFFSVMGLRTPQLEGKPGVHAKVIEDIKKNGNVCKEQLRKVPRRSPSLQAEQGTQTLENDHAPPLRCSA